MYFITGNNNKFLEVKSILPDVEQFEIDLPEIQDINPQAIIEAKLLEAKKQNIDSSFFVEDTSLYIDALGGLPGPLIKRFLQTLQPQWLYDVIEKLWNTKATAKTIIGYYNNATDTISYHEWAIEGTIVEPTWTTNFGWDVIFQPLWYTDTFATMDKSVKNSISMRKRAVENLKSYLEGL